MSEPTPAPAAATAALDFQQMREWIAYVVRSQGLCRYVIAGSGGFFTLVSTRAETDAAHLIESLFIAGSVLVALSLVCGAVALLGLMALEARLSERLVTDGETLDLDRDDFADTYWYRRLIALAVVSLGLGVVLAVLALDPGLL